VYNSSQSYYAASPAPVFRNWGRRRHDVCAQDFGGVPEGGETFGGAGFDGFALDAREFSGF
jgi:hypothetical protein